MAYTFKVMIDKLKKEPKRIVFTEGSDPRILEAASRLLASNFLTPILLGKVDEVEKAAEVEGFNIRGAVIIDPENYDKMDEMVDMFCEIRNISTNYIRVTIGKIYCSSFVQVSGQNNRAVS